MTTKDNLIVRLNILPNAVDFYILKMSSLKSVQPTIKRLNSSNLRIKHVYFLEGFWVNNVEFLM